MGQLGALRSRLGSLAPAVLPLVLWTSLWFSLQPGDIERIGSSRSLWPEVQNLRTLVPLLAGLAAVVFIANRLVGQQAPRHIFFGPMGLAAVYGFVGVISVLLSPDSSVALYWVAVYIAVPLVAWAIASNGDSLNRVSQLVIFNWVVIVGAVAVLVLIAFSFLDLHRYILEPSNLLECPLRSPGEGESWHGLTSGKLRSTGVGRYAAIAAILALGGLWHGRWRFVWGLVLLGAMLLLLTSGARTSFIGFGFAAALVIFLNGGWKVALAGFVGVAALGTVLWSTGLDEPILDHCLLSGYTPGTSLLRVQPSELQSEPTTPTEQPATPTPTAAPTQPTPPEPDGEADEPDGSNPTVVPTSQPTPSPDSTGTVDPETQVSPEPDREADEPDGSNPTVVPTGEPASSLDPTGRVEPETQIPPAGQTGATAMPERPAAVTDGNVTTTEPTQAPTQMAAAPDPTAAPIISPAAPDVGTQEEGQASQDASSPSSEAREDGGGTIFGRLRVPAGLFTFSGRSVVWKAGWDELKNSPFLGYGFQGDRLLLGTHMHNAMLHALFQTGWIGFIPFAGALLWAWVNLIMALRVISRLSLLHKHLLIQAAGILAFLTLRTIWESTGAFFGVDWIILCAIFFYIQLVNAEPRNQQMGESDPVPRARAQQ